MVWGQTIHYCSLLYRLYPGSWLEHCLPHDEENHGGIGDSGHHGGDRDPSSTVAEISRTTPAVSEACVSCVASVRGADQETS